MPMITWIIPVYNGKKYIKQAIQSILKQPCRDLEVVVVDDGSEDCTRNIVQRIRSKRVRYSYKENGGASSARNYGLIHSVSTYVAFLDSDDVLCKDVYNEEIHKILKSDEYDLLSFPFFRANQKLTRGIPAHVPDIEGDLNSKDISCVKHFCSFIYKRTVFEGDLAVFFPEGIRYQEDVTFLFQILHKAYRVKVINRFLFTYRYNPNSIVHTISKLDRYPVDATRAWCLCRKGCIGMDADTLNECDAWLFSNLAQFIKYSCRYGTSVKEILDVIDSLSLKETLDNYNNLWNSSKQIYEAFLRDPVAYQRRERKIGRIESIRNKVVSNPIVRELHHRTKYKMNIQQYL